MQLIAINFPTGHREARLREATSQCIMDIAHAPWRERVCLEGAWPRTTTHVHARPRTTTHDHARPTTHDHARPRTITNDHERPCTTDHARPRTSTNDHARPHTTTHVLSIRRLPYLFGDAVDVVLPCERLNTNFHSVIRLASRGDLGSCRSQLIYFACGFTVQAIVEQ